MKTYTNKVEINGEVFTHTIHALDYKDALQINKERKQSALLRGRRVFGRLTKAD